MSLMLDIGANVNAAHDWLKPNQNSRNDREEVNIKLPLKQVWKKQGTIGQASPVYMDGKLYIQDRGGLIGKWLGDYLYINEVEIDKGEVKRVIIKSCV
ncbi:hypothetical protein KAR34_11190, partial [bacterium]|nr:hypothetical protein [bacterium]